MDFTDSTRATYDTVAVDYEAMLRDHLDQTPLDRHLLQLFAERITSGPVADLGCGPGRLTAFLRSLGVDVRGLDLSPGMIAVARQRHPDVCFVTGDLRALPYGDRELSGALAWYSIIHLPPDDLPLVASELARVVRPGGPVLLAFQVGVGEHVHSTQAYGHPVDRHTFRHDPAAVVDALCASGLRTTVQVTRQPELAYETTVQAYVMASSDGPLDGDHGR